MPTKGWPYFYPSGRRVPAKIMEKYKIVRKKGRN